MFSRIICILVALYFILHAAFGVANWDDYLVTRTHMIRYLFFPLGIGLLFLTCAFVLTNRNRWLVGLYSVAILCAFYLVEYYLTYKFYFDRPGMVEEDTVVAGVDLGFTPRRLNGYLGTAALEDVIMGHFPHSTIELCSVDYGPVRLRTDRFGLNNPDEAFDQPVRFVVTGDSFIHGHCQPAGKDVVGVVRETVPGTVNLGLTGTGPLFQLAVIGRNVAALRPEHVVACFYEGNDLRDLPGELGIPWLSAALDPAADFGPSPAKAEVLARLDGLNRRHAAGEKLDPWLMGNLRRDKGWRDLLTNPAMLRNFLALNLTTSMLGVSYERAPSHLDDYRAILAREKEIVEGWGGRLHLCYLPTRNRFGVISSNYAYDEIRDRVLEVAAELDLPVFDVTDEFAANAEPTRLYASDGHLSIDGAALVADLLADYLTNLGSPAPTTPN